MAIIEIPARRFRADADLKTENINGTWYGIVERDADTISAVEFYPGNGVAVPETVTVRHDADPDLACIVYIVAADGAISSVLGVERILMVSQPRETPFDTAARLDIDEENLIP